MQIRNYLSLVLMLFSTISFAADAVQMFATKNECLQHFTSSSSTTDVLAGENYCKNKVVKSATDVCADKKLLEFKMKTSISSTQEAQYFQKFKLECISGSTATGAAQQANQSAQTTERDAQVGQQKAAAAAAKAQGATPQEQQAAATKAKLDVLKAILPAVDKVGATPDKATADAPKQGPASASGTAEAAAADKKVEAAAAVPNPETKPATAEEARDHVDPDVAAKAVAAGGKPSTDDVAGAAEKFANSPLKNVANDAQKSTSTPSDAAAPPTEITSASDSLTSTTEADLAQITSTTPESCRQTISLAYNQTIVSMKEFDAKWKSFLALKKTCTKLAETSGFLCIEKSSPGAQATKALVDTSGPILGAISSAQKTCSSTADVTDLAGKVMTIAKATCVTAKMACDSGCAAANANLTALQGMVKAMNGKAANDFKAATTDCSKYKVEITQTNYLNCNQENTRKQGVANSAIQKLDVALKKEIPPATPGTVPYMSAKCAANMSDIVALAGNVIQLAMAEKGAAECDENLSGNGAAGGGGGVTSTQYCETPANSGTQFCKCKLNANQEGCPGFAGNGSLIDKDANKDSVAGLNLKTGKGLSSFAGGSRGTATGFGANGKQEYNPSAPGTGEKLALTGADAAAAGSGGGIGGGSGRSSAGGAGEGASGKPEEKKWSFGSFANALGGMFGGSSAGKGANSKGNGSASNSKQEAAIKRKLASDKLAGEITSASGKSNWEKVHQVYLIKDSTLITGN